MPTCIAFLRAVNVGKRQYAMAELREALTETYDEARALAVHLMLDKPYHEARTSNAEVERFLGVATTRNLTVITKLAEKWGT